MLDMQPVSSDPPVASRSHGTGGDGYAAGTRFTNTFFDELLPLLVEQPTQTSAIQSARVAGQP